MANEIAPINPSMLDRWNSFSKRESIMDSIHQVKIYNANTFANESVDETKAWTFRVKSPDSEELIYMPWPIKINILSVCKVKSWSVFFLDEFGDPALDESGKPKKWFFTTNEHSLFTKKIDTLWFKQLGWKVLWFYPKVKLEEMLKTKRINGKDNPFWKQWKKIDWTPYNDTNIKDTIIVYGKFLEWPLAWDYFKFVPLSSSWYWTNYKNWETVKPDEWTLLYAISEWLEAWNKARESNSKSKVQSVDPSQLDMTLSFRETEVQGKRMFIPTFKFDMLTAYREDNTDDLNYILELQSQYLEQEFWVRVLVDNFRLWSIHVDKVWDPTSIEVKQIATTNTEEVEAELEVSDAVEVFNKPANMQVVNTVTPKTNIKESSAETLKKLWVPF